MNTVLSFLGLVLVFTGLTYLYRPSWILVINKFARERVFCDARVLLERRKKGVLMLLCAILFFYWSYYRAHYGSTRVMDSFVSIDRLLYQSHKHFASGDYKDAIQVCNRIIERDPNNLEAYYQLAAARYITGDRAIGDWAWHKAESMNPPGSSSRARDMCMRFNTPTTAPLQ